MINETYIHRDTSEVITIDINNNKIKIGEDRKVLFNIQINLFLKLYKYNKEIFKEFIENYETKYNHSIIDFLINNQISQDEMKRISEITLFPLNIPSNSIMKILVLSDFDINIVDFFKYIYSKPYEEISLELINNYFNYINELFNKNKLTKYNKFPHNPLLSHNILNNNKIEKNKNKDIIMDIKKFHIEFFGNKCEYYITYQDKKYDLLDDNDRLSLLKIFRKLGYNEKLHLYLSEYYKRSYLYNIIKSFEDKEYYTKTIKEDIIYILKDNYNNFNKKEINKITKVISNSTKNIYNIKKNLFTNNFRKNLYILDFLNLFIIDDDSNKIIENKEFYNIRNRKLLKIYHKNFLKQNDSNKIINQNNIEIKQLNILEFIDLINKNEYLNESIDSVFSYIFDNNFYLCTDKETKEKLFIYQYFQDLGIDGEIKFINKSYSLDFLKRIEDLKI